MNAIPMQKMDASISVSLDMDLTFTPAPVQMATSLVKMKSPVTQQASDTKKNPLGLLIQQYIF